MKINFSQSVHKQGVKIPKGEGQSIPDQLKEIRDYIEHLNAYLDKYGQPINE
jgi:hypothetical protein